MSVAVVIVGINGWEEYTRPCINSIRACEPKADIIVIDNGSEPAYPELEYIHTQRLDKQACYPAALNAGIGVAEEREHDWVLLCNNDVLFSRPFAKFVEMQNPQILYGFYVHEIKDREYISSWAMFINKHAWLKVGMFDESLKPMGYEDADYCFRAVDKGLMLCSIDRKQFGIEHLAKGGTSLPNENLEYVKVKHDI